MTSVASRLSIWDRYLTVLIFAAMVVGVALGWVAPGIGGVVERFSLGEVSIPVFAGLLAMMLPVFLKVRYERMRAEALRPKVIALSLVLTWGIGPLVMYGLASLLLRDLPHYRTGLVLVGIAPCIGMVLVWNMLARGDEELAAFLVALNSVIQVAMFGVLAWVYLTVLPGLQGQNGVAIDVSPWAIAKSVFFFLGLPLGLGYAARRWLRAKRGASWYDEAFVPKVGKIPLVGLLYTVVLLFAMQGEKIVALPLDVVRIAVPLVAFFLITFLVGFFVSRAFGLSYGETTALAFTGSSNNFELAIAVAVAVYGVRSGEALAGTVGPMVEVPALIGLVRLALWLQDRVFRRPSAAPASGQGIAKHRQT